MLLATMPEVKRAGQDSGGQLNALTWTWHVSLWLSAHSSQLVPWCHPTTMELECTNSLVAQMGGGGIWITVSMTSNSIVLNPSMTEGRVQISPLWLFPPSLAWGQRCLLPPLVCALVIWALLYLSIFQVVISCAYGLSPLRAGNVSFGNHSLDLPQLRTHNSVGV